MARQAGIQPHPKSTSLRPVWVLLVLAAIVAIIYAPVRHFEFVNWDDGSYIGDNPNVLGGLTWRSVKWALTTGYSPYWHPITWLSHLLDVQLFGLDAGGHHVTSLLFHLANSVLVFELFRRMTAATGRSAFVAGMFAVHPLHVESVAWVAERKDVLSTFFWILTTWAYVAYVRRGGWQRYALVLGLFALALMSKPMVVTLPFVLLLLDIWPLRRVVLPGDPARTPGTPDASRVTWRRAIVEKFPLVALAIATGVATFVIQKRVGAVAGLEVLPVPARIANALVGYCAYVAKTLWPVHLAAFYPYEVRPLWLVAIAALALVTATAAAFRCRIRYPYVLVGWFWYVMTVAPVIGLLQAGEQSMADRFMYVPMLGLLVIAAWGVPDVLQWERDRGTLIPIAAVVAIVVCAGIARVQVSTWSDSITLWRHAIRVTPANYHAYENLGQALRDAGRLDAALGSYQRGLALAPAGSPALQAVLRNDIALVLTRQGRTADAIAEFTMAARLNPDFAESRNNLANALAAEGRYAEAVEHYAHAVRLKPDFTEAQVGLGSALLSQRNAGDAIVHYREALRLQPDLAEAHNGLGAALAMQGEDGDAAKEYAEALRLKPDLTTAHFNFAVLLVKQGDLAAAREHLHKAVATDPEYQPARELLARLSR